MVSRTNEAVIGQAYLIAEEQYTQWGIDVKAALEQLARVPISVHCWQTDDVGGFEGDAGLTGGGILATGTYPGKARTADEVRADFEKVLSLVPGTHRFNLHAIYLENAGKPVGRDEIEPKHFKGWIDWAKAQDIGLDFNGTYFSHPKADSGFTLSHPDPGIRRFWIDHGIACRRVGEAMGRALGTPCVTNVWIPDGFKDIPVDRKGPRERLKQSLDAIFAEKLDRTCNLDAVESKLFGIGSESCVVGSHEFYLSYALTNDVLLCLDMGHFHPTELVADKISSVMTFVDELLLHVSRPVRWDSDHVVIVSDELRMLAQELVRGDYLDRTHIGLDFFDASINRVAAYVIGTRATLKALLMAFLEPYETLRQMEVEGDYTSRLAMLEELKTLPCGAIWDYFCLEEEVPVGATWLEEVKTYEREVLSKRD